MLLKFNIRRGRTTVTIDYSVVCRKRKMFAEKMELKVNVGREKGKRERERVQFSENF